MKYGIKANKYNILYVLIFGLLLFISLTCFNYLIASPIDRTKFNFHSQLYALFNVAFFIAIYIIVGNRKYIFFVLFSLFQLFLISNLLYFRTYDNIASIYVLGQFNNLDGLTGSILHSFRKIDLLFISIPISLIASYYTLVKKKRADSLQFKTRVYSASIIISVILLIILFDLSPSRQPNGRYSSRLEGFEYDITGNCISFGPIVYSGWSINKYFNNGDNNKISDKDIVEIKEWLKNQGGFINSVKETNTSKKNIILIIVESLESWPIGHTIGNVEVTPFLNQIIKKEKNIFAPNVVPQTKDGHSSDIQIMLNTGLLPLSEGAVFYRFPYNKYYSIPKMLKSTCGDYCATVMGTKSSYWNQNTINPELGYDSLFSSDNLVRDDFEGMGLSDASIFRQTLEKIDKSQKPFFFEIITLSSHDPFILSQKNRRIKFNNELPVELNNYLTSINYTDYAIGSFINELKKRSCFDNSIIVIVGDHEALPKDIRGKIEINKYCKELNTMEPYVPFIVINSSFNLKYNDRMGQIDIFPTLQDVLGLSSSWKGVGNDILSKNNTKIVVDGKRNVYSPIYSVNSPEVKHAVDAWEISDKIIRSNYFKYQN